MNWISARQYETETTLNGRAVFVRVSRPHGASKWSAEASFADDGDHSRFGRGKTRDEAARNALAALATGFDGATAK